MIVSLGCGMQTGSGAVLNGTLAVSSSREFWHGQIKLTVISPLQSSSQRIHQSHPLSFLVLAQ